MPSASPGLHGRPRYHQLPRIRIVVLGAQGVGKSALTVRYLTRRYISEYRRAIDLLYRHTVCLDDVTSEVEILDVSLRQDESEGVSSTHTRWGEGFVVVYSVDDAASFRHAGAILDSLQRLKAPIYVPVILLANKRDLDPGRQVSVEEGQALSLQHGCQFYEVSAAESHVGVTLAFQALLRETRSLQLTRPLPRQRRISIVAVSRMIGSLIGRGPDAASATLMKPTLIVQEAAGKRTLRRKDKKRPSLSL
ncbi:ras-related and estrogen-regulated growth inhibitor isoform X2 [Procambarus clarkii]|nr:ras-related and estrogen-regulated growth inhibitor-like isoform X2 [Procambarus clarkii]